MRYYISDLHFFHESLNSHMDLRGFSSAEEMNDAMICRWNEKVKKNDEVIVLGDLSVGKGKETNEILRQLKGKIYLIEGNHDRYLKDKEFDCGRLEWVKPYAELRDNKRKVILSHYPIFFYNGQYLRDTQTGIPKTYMLYGHVHDTFDERMAEQFQKILSGSVRVQRGDSQPRPVPCQMINCFCCYSDYTPLTLDEWIECDRKRKEKRNF